MYVKKEIDYAGKKLVLETGKLAGQATLAVKASYGESVVLATVVMGEEKPDYDGVPLMIAYEEKLYSAGAIKSSPYVKRDGRPSDDATVTGRLIDHAVRPLLPKDLRNDIQVIIYTLSLDEEADIEFLAMNAVAALLHASKVPFYGPMVSTKVGYVNDDYVLNPPHTNEKEDMYMMLSFVGEDKKFLAIEAEINNLAEKKVLGGIEFARNNSDDLIKLMNDFAEAVNPGIQKAEYTSYVTSDELYEKSKEIALPRIKKIFEEYNRANRKAGQDEAFAMLREAFSEEEYTDDQLKEVLILVEKKFIRKEILENSKRPDGRALSELRPISAEAGLLPRTHGTGLFNRGETQVLSIATLANPSYNQVIQDMHGEREKRYMHHYNFPPFSTGEVGRVGGVKNREIGHGMLAERAIKAVLPDVEAFPYTIMVNSEVLSSNGSTSMASACGSTLALLDAGVPLKAMVAGISIGLIVDDNDENHILLTDIIGLEDWCGFMDFKITGTENGITAVQLDMKVKGIPMELLPRIFEQSKEARLSILEVMKGAINTPNTISKYAPKMVSISIDPEKIGMVIGAGGKTIKELQETNQVEIAIEQDGKVFISGTNQEGIDRARTIIEGMTKEYEVGDIVDGVVDEVVAFGAFIELPGGQSGLVHVSEIAEGFVKNVDDYLSAGQDVKVKVIGIKDGKLSLSIKALKEQA